MKIRKVLSFLTILPILSGCVIWSFYPFYSEKDLFENDILSGKWIDEDSLIWNFSHPVTKNGTIEIMDKKSYELNMTDYDLKKTRYSVNLFKLDKYVFLDFFVQQIENQPGVAAKSDVSWWSLHVLPVHTIAKLTVEPDTLKINWIDGDWLEKQINEKKIKIKHENNGDVLLTAKTADLQKMILKIADSEEAFKDGVTVKLVKNE